MPTNRLLLGLSLAVTSATLLAATTAPAFAQATYYNPAQPAQPAPAPVAPLWGPPPPPPPAQRQPPASAIAPNGEYVAPLSQDTQPSYVPQSVALSGPRVLKDWEDGQPIPYGYHRETRVRKGAIIGGSLSFGIPYLYSALIASAGSDVAGSGSNKAAALYVPVLGPFMEMAETDSATLRYMLLLDGVAQSVGAALAIYGVTTPRPVLVRNDLAMVTVMPMPVGRDGNGIGLFGRF